MTPVSKPKHDRRIKGPKGDSLKPRGVIVHTTEGTPRPGPSDRHGVIDYLANSRGLSVPVVVDDEGSTMMVEPPHHGEHAGCVNGCFGIEQIGTARWTAHDWKQHDATVKRAARWAAWYLSERMSVAVTHENLRKLVVGHDRDHVFGGCSDHWDPGPNYPWARFRDHAVAYARQSGYKVVATKGERRRVRKFRASAPKKAWAWARKKVRRGWRVAVQKKPLRGDLEG